jgi:hypothetical protein
MLGLAAWDEAPPERESFILETLARQEIYGAYDTTQLSLLALAMNAKPGLLQSLTEASK